MPLSNDPRIRCLLRGFGRYSEENPDESRCSRWVWEELIPALLLIGLGLLIACLGR